MRSLCSTTEYFVCHSNMTGFLKTVPFMNLTVSCRPFTPESLVRTRISLCEIGFGKIGAGTGSSPDSVFFPPSDLRTHFHL